MKKPIAERTTEELELGIAQRIFGEKNLPLVQLELEKRRRNHADKQHQELVEAYREGQAKAFFVHWFGKIWRAITGIGN